VAGLARRIEVAAEALQHYGAALRQSRLWLYLRRFLPWLARSCLGYLLRCWFDCCRCSFRAYFPDGSAPDPCVDSAPRTATPILR